MDATVCLLSPRHCSNVKIGSGLTEFCFHSYAVRGASVAFYDRVSTISHKIMHPATSLLVISPLAQNLPLQSIMNQPIVKGYGKVSADENAPAVTADTAFMIASISKVFGGAAVMKLIEDGLIDSEQDDICWVLPEEYGIGSCRHPNFQDDKVTWAHIMTHTSSMVGGIPDGKKRPISTCV